VRSWTGSQPTALPGRGVLPRLAHSPTASVSSPVTGSAARLYVCGITPYDATHLGHAATYVAFDLLHRCWLDAGLTVRYVQNVTDVDDPLLARATATGEPWRELADRQIELFRQDMVALRVLPPHAYLGVVEAIPRVVDMVSALLAAGAAYRLDDDIYFTVAAAPHLGEVSGLDHARMVALSAERGGDPDRPGKKDPVDPLLWRHQRPGEPSWPSPFGPGRPGWHVECAAIAVSELGAQIDVQGGGVDLVFPHHELGAAHAEVVTGHHPFARAYVHAGMVGYQGEKMSKSRGNLVFVSALRAAGTDPMALRAALLAEHYRRDWEWTPALLSRAEQRLGRWRAATEQDGPDPAPLLARVRAALADDLHADRALDALDAWADPAQASAPVAGSGAQVRRIADSLLGLDLGPVAAG
jgi:L-cysteine:1D-myo-inositol 2-amino-2-deoxy-alpha-D-glucopyranoside ligase